MLSGFKKIELYNLVEYNFSNHSAYKNIKII